MTTADLIRQAPKDQQYAQAVIWMEWRDCQPLYVVFHFKDGSSVKFKKVYTLDSENE